MVVDMPKPLVKLTIYLKDKEEAKMIKEVAAKLGVSVSQLVREFFRSLSKGSNNIQINTTTTVYNVNVNIQQQQVVQINQTLIASIKLQLNNIYNILAAAAKDPDMYNKHNAIIMARDQLQAIIKSLN